MNKNLIFFVVLLIFVITFLTACSSNEKNNIKSQDLSELQITACESAHDGGTCDTKLEELGIVSKKECCDNLNKCC